MINSNFFPTPKSVIDMMVAPYYDSEHGRYVLERKTILEPSAGKGDIIDHLVQRYHVQPKNISCVEIEPELQMILTGKGYKVINDNFLTYDDRYSFDLILMNPPFSEGVDHLLKAWEILRAGDIACILNAETIENPHTEKRKLLRRLIDAHGRYELVGNVFKNAERSTDVNCAIVWLKKCDPASSVAFESSGFDQDAAFDKPEYRANPLANPDLIQSLVDQCDHAMKMLVEKHQAQSKYQFYVKGIFRDIDTRSEHSLNDEIDALKQGFWRYVFDKTKVGQVTTSNFQRKFEEFSQQTGRLSFSKDNVMRILEMFFLNRDQIMQDCIIEVFDTATKYHEKNVVHTEGWKHNKSWKIASKIIMPNGVVFEPKYGGYWSTNHRNRDGFYTDIDKVLCFLSGKSMEQITSLAKVISDRMAILNRGVEDYDTLFSSTFFDVRFFKKGTVHLIFRDKDLLARFNQAAAQGKHWVGDGS